MKTYWPWHYAGLEPLNKNRMDWRHRYAAAFQVVPCDKKGGDSVSHDISPSVAAATESAGVSDRAALQQAIVEAHEA
jgi:hypothetical protein